jgi:hypothetical protein
MDFKAEKGLIWSWGNERDNELGHTFGRTLLPLNERRGESIQCAEKQ